MHTEDLFPLSELCSQYQVEVSFIHDLHDNGLVKITKVKDTEFVDSDMLTDVERFIRMHYDLSINMEGIEAIYHLLQKMERMQKELQDLHNQLNSYGI